MSRVEESNRTLDKAVIREYWQVNKNLLVVDEAMNEWSNTGMIITKIQIQGPELRKGGYLAIINAKDEAQHPFVAFRSGGSVKEVFSKIAADLEQGTLEMKEEKPWTPPVAQEATGS